MMEKKAASFPIYEVIEQETIETGLYKRFETRITIDAPLHSFYGVIGLKYKDSDPIYLQFHSATQKVSDEGDIFTVLIKESYEPYE